MTDTSTGQIDIRPLDREREATITTWGRRTGAEHSVVVWWAAADAAVIYVMAGYGLRSDWARNALSRGGTTVMIGRRRYAADARVIEMGAEHDRAAKSLATKYRPYPGEWETGHILALELTSP